MMKALHDPVLKIWIFAPLALSLNPWTVGASESLAFPTPGTVFREYVFGEEGSHFSEKDPDSTNQPGKAIGVPQHLDIDLEHAIGAEFSVEYWGGHSGTSEQTVSINGNQPMDLPLPEVPEGHESECYFRTILGNNAQSIPLEFLVEGDNSFVFSAGPQICYNFNWGFYWIYSFTVRVYYDPAFVSGPSARIAEPVSGSSLGENPRITVELNQGSSEVARVDVLGHYRDYDWSGMGIFRRWHFDTRWGELEHHVGSSTESPYQIDWDTWWLPDQDEPIQLIAKITDESGLSTLTEIVDDLHFERTERSVVMIPATDIPENFGSRVRRVRRCNLAFDYELDEVLSANMLVSTWSGESEDGKAHTILLNDITLADNFGILHDYDIDRIPVSEDLFIPGTNVFTVFSQTSGHLLEINWPGPVLFLETSSGSTASQWEKNEVINGWANLGQSYLGWLYVHYSPWHYVNGIGRWVYLSPSNYGVAGSWIYFYDYGAGHEGWFYSFELSSWIYRIPGNSSAPDGWMYVSNSNR